MPINIYKKILLRDIHIKDIVQATNSHAFYGRAGFFVSLGIPPKNKV